MFSSLCVAFASIEANRIHQFEFHTIESIAGPLAFVRRGMLKEPRRAAASDLKRDHLIGNYLSTSESLNDSGVDV